MFTDHFVTARVDFGIAFSIKFLSFSAFLGFRKALEQDAMSSSVSRSNISKTSASVSSGFKHEKTDESTRPQAECFYCFRVFETPMKHEARVFEITSPTKEN